MRMNSKILQQNCINDALYNLSARSGATDDYRKGVFLGMVSVLMAQGWRFEEARMYLMERLPRDYRKEGIPESWRDKE